MTLMLASVLSRDEAEIALSRGADIIDCKAPSRGALGALPLDAVAEIVAFVDGRRPVSAVVELPHDVAHALRDFEEVVAAGVDYVKFALPATPDAVEIIEALAPLDRKRRGSSPSSSPISAPISTCLPRLGRRRLSRRDARYGA